MRNRCMFEKMAAGMALAVTVMAGAAMLPESGHELIVRTYAADASNQNSQNISGGGTSTEDKIDETGSKAGCAENNENSDDGSGIYDFKDNKAAGAVAITKKWDGGLTNAEREIPDMYLSTGRPSKSTKGYTVTFHGNGIKFADGTDENMVVYNSSGQIVEGSYKESVETGVAWYANETCTQKIEISDAGIPQVELTGDVDLWAKKMTFEIKGYNDNYQQRTENPRPTKTKIGVYTSCENAKKAIESKKEKNARKKEAEKKEAFLPPHLSEIERTGSDYSYFRFTAGNVLMARYGLRGGEFGNYTSSKDRVGSINMAYDGFEDLYKALGISHRDISLGGELAIAFGARGRGSAMAHYEPDRNVINMTKKRGAGSLAHEWAHAMDAYLGKKLGLYGYMSENVKSDKVFASAKELLTAFEKQDGKETAFYAASKNFDGAYKKAGNGYWSSAPEMFARAFACYVRDKLGDRKSDCLERFNALRYMSFLVIS